MPSQVPLASTSSVYRGQHASQLIDSILNNREDQSFLDGDSLSFDTFSYDLVAFQLNGVHGLAIQTDNSQPRFFFFNIFRTWLMLLDSSLLIFVP
ncbi:MAG: hypothetical protein QW292_12385 [Candidatus Parvarchaeota archaeon]